jgi:hypothetical protein
MTSAGTKPPLGAGFDFAVADFFGFFASLPDRI